MILTWSLAFVKLIIEYVIDVYSAGFEAFALEEGYLAKCLLTHLKYEFPKEFSVITDWKGLLANPPPQGCVSRLRLVAKKRIFEGTCEICEAYKRSERA